MTHAARNDDPHAFHAVGHQAVLIGNDKEGWTFYSYDSDHSDSSNGNDNFTRGAHFNSISEFANSEYNTFKDDYDDGQGKNTSHTNYAGGIIQRFEEGYRISTTEEQDAAMNKAAFEVFDTEYSISKGHQCTTVPEKALQAAGLNDGEDNYAGNNTKWDGIFDENIFPISKHYAIERLNKGQEIDDSLKLLK